MTNEIEQLQAYTDEELENVYFEAILDEDVTLISRIEVEFERRERTYH